MISRLKRKFIITATVSMFLLMTVLVLIMNLVNYYEVISESDQIMEILSQPGVPPINDKTPAGPKDMQPFMPVGMSPEVLYESRFFIVMVSPDGEILQSDLSRIISVDEASAKDYISRALDSRNARGFIGQFRYAKAEDARGTRILFLDCGRRLDSFRSFLLISIGVGLFGCVLVFIVFVLAAGRIVAPIADSYKKQKRFISDAGHEIKTPLTIINANVDLLESEGEKEELADIRQQTERLTELTNELIMLSKMEESEQTLQKIDIPLSDLVAETAASFRAPAAARGLSFTAEVTPGITANASPDAVRHLVSLLMENAVKYSPDGGEIRLKLTAQRRAAVLTVFNTTENDVDGNDLPHVFDRFYRADTSRNSQTGGHGIGLSIAKAIVDAHGGSIAAATKSGNDFLITVTLPQ